MVWIIAFCTDSCAGARKAIRLAGHTRVARIVILAVYNTACAADRAQIVGVVSADTAGRADCASACAIFVVS